MGKHLFSIQDYNLGTIFFFNFIQKMSSELSAAILDLGIFIRPMCVFVTVADAPVCCMSASGLHDGYLAAHHPQTMEKVCVFAVVFYRSENITMLV